MDHDKIRLGSPEVQLLTAELAGGLKSAMMTGDELPAMNSGEL
jgi:hypothetical protein